MVAFNFQERFADKVASGEKPSTIRSTMRCKIGDSIQLYTGQRTKECRKLGEGVCVGVAEITIGLADGTPWAISGRIGEVFHHSRLSQQEGFKNEMEMVDFFRQRYGLPFTGYLHAWELKETRDDEQ